MTIYSVQCSTKSTGPCVLPTSLVPWPVPRLKNPPDPPFVKGGLGEFRQIVECFNVVGSFSLEALSANSVSWANVKVHVRLNQ